MMSQSSLIAVTLLASAWAQAAPVSLDQGFRNVPDGAKPWVYWWWVNGNVDEETITRDLEGMKRNGIGGLLMFDARGYHEDHVPMPPSKMDFMSPPWRHMLKFALEKAAQLGLQVSVNLSSCAGALKGPWEVGDDAPKKLVWTATKLRGPKLDYELKKPEGKRFWEVAVLAVRHDRAAAQLWDQWQDLAPKLGAQPSVTEVVDLTAKVDAQGKLAWDVPSGDWTLLRFGCVTMEGHEYDVDILDPKAVEGHFNRMGKAILQDAGPRAGKTLTHFYSVSWEGAAPTWTLALEQEFQKYRGYPLRPWLPVLAGFTVGNSDQSQRFLRDYYRTLSDCFCDNFYGRMAALCHAAGLQWHSESGGPWDRKLASFAEADQLAFLGRNDMPQGEFWFMGDPPSRNPQNLNRPQAMAAHIYGRPLAASEAFTHMVQHWSAYPAVLKPLADSAFCDGVNQFVWHTFTASPAEFGKPGIEYFAGTHINRNVTWFPQAGAFLTYLGRCQFLLRQGLPVSDVCVYIGDKPYLHWGRAASWSDRATLRLPRGFTYDLLTTEVLLDRLEVKEGNLVLPDGLSYRILVVDPDDESMLPAALRKIAALKKAGATVVCGQRRPQRVPGLAGYPDADEQVRRLASGLWTQSPALGEALQAKGLLPDFEGPCDYTHRRTRDADIYFVSGQGACEGTFRVSGKQPELWDAVHGTISTAANWRASRAGRTVVALDLPENGSTFVVFRRPGRPPQSPPPLSPKPQEKTLPGPWTVTFEPGRGAPESAVFEQLTPWNEHPQEGIKFFSGKATYRTTFDLSADEAKRALRLQLGEVKCIAQVRCNGTDLGVVWTAPWSVELTGVVQAGRNELEIDVVNTWVNRLIGDAGQPKEKRITRTSITLQQGQRTIKAYQGFASMDPLMRSGLLGPVRLELRP